MALELDTTEVIGGYRIIDTDRHQSYQGVALVVQRDAHPIIRDCEITREEALYRAKVMAASQDLLEALQAFERISDIWLPATSSEEHEGEMRALHEARNDMLAAIRKATV